MTKQNRVYYLDYVKALIIVLIVAHHSALAYSLATISEHNYVYSTAPIIDSKKLFIFDYFEKINDIYFMPLMFLISGFFVYSSIKKRGAGSYIKTRFFRIMVPFIFSIIVLMPMAYYPTSLAANQHNSFMHYMMKDYILNFYHVPGPIWFLLALFIFDCLFALFYKIFPKTVENLIQSINEMGKINYALTFISVAILVYFLSYILLPSGDVESMSKLGPIWFKKKTSILYFCFFMFGVFSGAAEKFRNLITKDGKFLTDTWLFRVVAAIMLYGVYRYMKKAMAVGSPEYIEIFIYCALYVFIAIAASSAWLATIGKFMNKSSRTMNSLTQNSFGIFIFHFVVVVWMQYALRSIDLGASQKFYTVFSSSLLLSWLVTLILRKVPFIKHVL